MCLFGVPGIAFRVAVSLASLLGGSDDFHGNRQMTRKAIVSRLVDGIKDFDYKKYGSEGRWELGRVH